MNKANERVVSIGVVFDEADRFDTTFMDAIISSGIADSGLESNGDVFFEDNMQGKKMNEEEFDSFLLECDIDPKDFREW